jgi:hypothetical protein
MSRSVISAGLLGGVVLMLWTMVIDGLLGFRARIDMKQVAAERQLHETLKEHISDPGRYVVNPGLTPDGRFPDAEPVFGVLYGGGGHEAAGRLMLAGLAVGLAATIVAAWVLSQMSGRVLSSYGRKMAVFVAIGLLVALVGDLSNFGIGGYPPGDAVVLASRHVLDWTLVGLVIAWRIGPRRTDLAAVSDATSPPDAG